MIVSMYVLARYLGGYMKTHDAVGVGRAQKGNTNGVSLSIKAAKRLSLRRKSAEPQLRDIYE